MPKNVHQNEHGPQEVRNNARQAGKIPAQMSPERDFRKARQNWVGWMLYYEATHPDELPSRTEMARRLHVVKSTLTPLLKLDEKTAPSFETLVASADLTGFPLDTLINHPPPPIPPGVTQHKRGKR